MTLFTNTGIGTTSVELCLCDWFVFSFFLAIQWAFGREAVRAALKMVWLQQTSPGKATGSSKIQEQKHRVIDQRPVRERGIPQGILQLVYRRHEYRNSP